MKIKNSKNFAFVLVLFFTAVLNGILFYMIHCVGEYVQTRDIWGNTYSEQQKLVTKANKMLGELSADEDAIVELYAEQEVLLEYLSALLYRDGDGHALNPQTYLTVSERDQYADEIIFKNANSAYKTTEQVSAQLELVAYCLEHLEYAKTYPEYINYVLQNCDIIASSSLYSDDSWQMKNIIKTEQDFYGMEKIKIVPAVSIGIAMLLGYRITDILAVVMIVLYSYVCFYSLREDVASSMRVNKRSFVGKTALLGIGIIVLYTTNILLTNLTIGVGSLNRSIQSVHMFRSCSTVMSTGMFLAVWTLFKVVGCLILFFIVFGIKAKSIHKTKFFDSFSVIGLCVFLLVELCLHVLSSTILSEINVFSCFSIERFFMRYRNINFFGEAVQVFTLFMPFIILTSVFIIIFASKRINGYAYELQSIAEQAYFDDLNSKHTEIRQIQHDIHNHLTALAVLLDNERTDDARRYLNEISKTLCETPLPIKTGSTVLDALLFKKIEHGKSLGINIQTELLVSVKSSSVSDYDLCSVFGNMIDNAVEACKKLPEDEREIVLTVKKRMDMICIFCMNQYADIKQNKDTFLTTKSDVKAHGYGLKRISQIAEKYGGIVEILAEEGIFTISVLIQIRE